MERNIIAAIENRLKENKKGARTYAKYEAAEQIGRNNADLFEKQHPGTGSMEYIVVFLPYTKRWTVVYNFSKWQARSQQGTYIGWFADLGFWSV